MSESSMDECINDRCPWSGEPVSPDSLTLYRGRTVGFCNPGCRDKFDRAIELFEVASNVKELAGGYEQREFKSLKDWAIGRQRLKVYGISIVGESRINDELIASARSYADNVLPGAAEAEGEIAGPGYCILHPGDMGIWLLIHWWAHRDICCQRMALAPKGTTSFAGQDDRPLHACVWEQVVISHERDAWIRFGTAPVPDHEGYFGYRLADGRY